MGIFDKIKFKKDEKGQTVEKAEKVGTSQTEGETTEVEKAAKVMPVAEGARTSISATNVATIGQVILRPIITEKSAHLAAENKYVFAVDSSATRVDVKTAIKAMYNVSPTSVNMTTKIGKTIRFGRREGKRKDWKRAIVTLPKGSSINVYEGV